MSATRYKDINQEQYHQNPLEHDKLTHQSTQGLVYEALEQHLREHLKHLDIQQTLRVLDYGCGSGLSTALLSTTLKQLNCTAKITGIDINTHTIEQAKEKVPGASFVVIEKAEPVDHLGKFDFILCNFVLVELKEKEMKAVLENINSLLSENGIAFITNCASKTYKPGSSWATLNTQFDENKPSEMRNGKVKLKEDQPVKNQVFDSFSKTSTFTFFDFFHSGEAYRRCLESSGLDLLQTIKPKATASADIPWQDELKVSPYKIHVVKKTNIELKQQVKHSL